MAYRFASTDTVEFAIAPFTGTTFGAMTFAAYLKRTVVSTLDTLIYFGTSGLSDRYVWTLQSNNRLQIDRGGAVAQNTATVASTTTWYLLAVTCAAGNSTPRFHIHNGSSWVHEAGSGAITDGAALAGTNRLIFSGAFGSIAFEGDLVCCGIKKADSTDLAVEALSRTAFSAWTGFGFDWLIGFDSSLVSGGKLQDQASPGTGDEITRSGTTLVSDPPGWAWTGGGGATPNSGFLGFM